MQVSLLLCVVLYAGCTVAGSAVSESPYPRGCIYVNERCVKECEVGTHGYTTGCGPLLPEATCENPNPKLDPKSGSLCDFSACYCDAPTVRSKSGACIPVSECVNEPKTEAPAENLARRSEKVPEKPSEKLVENAEAAAAAAEKLLHPNGCYYINGECASVCPKETHGYRPGCQPLLLEATCDNPNPIPDTSNIVCDHRGCYCNAPTVRSAEGDCIPLSKCPK